MLTYDLFINSILPCVAIIFSRLETLCSFAISSVDASRTEALILQITLLFVLHFGITTKKKLYISASIMKMDFYPTSVNLAMISVMHSSNKVSKKGDMSLLEFVVD